MSEKPVKIHNICLDIRQLILKYKSLNLESLWSASPFLSSFWLLWWLTLNVRSLLTVIPTLLLSRPAHAAKAIMFLLTISATALSLQHLEHGQQITFKQSTPLQTLLRHHLLFTPQHHRQYFTHLAQLQLLFPLKLHQLSPQWAQMRILGQISIKLQQLPRQLHQLLFLQHLPFSQARAPLLIIQPPALKIAAILHLEYAMHAIIGFILTRINVSQSIHYAWLLMLKEETAPHAMEGIISYQENVSWILIM